jgi:phosphopantothenoylcysteine decarboxylase/phosphopantothenate--cysteine ligase
VTKAILGVCGSVSAYRAADLARDMMRAGMDVRVCLTDGAEQFVTPILFETLTGNPCLTNTFEEPEKGRMAHIDWARWADILVIAPASANTLNRIATGAADDMLTTLALVYQGQIVFAPAMNPSMYSSEATQKSSRILEGKNVVITGGPTREAIDSVRYLTNRSSGKMSIALARAAFNCGANVELILGPVSQPIHNVIRERASLKVTRVISAAEMGAALNASAPNADWIIGAAAVADYRPSNPITGKLRRKSEPFNLELMPNEDLLANARKLVKPTARVVGFAAEPTGEHEVALEKLRRKNLFAIAANDISRSEIGFESDQNEIDLIFADGTVLESGMKSKLACAVWIWEELLKKNALG